tara:strand:- start:112 stop:426 length:315 start_codon:yes stop_codon:yes gene_type:complete
MKKENHMPGKVTEDKPTFVVSNLGEDRIYGNLFGEVRLINQDGTTYKGKIFKRRITMKNIDNSNYFSFVYETEDNRFFNKGGMPIKKPTNMVKQSDNEDTDESK